MAPSNFYRMQEGNMYFEHALILARDIIAERLQAGWLDGSLDDKYVQRILPLYDEEYNAFVLSKIKTYEEERNAKSQITILMDSSPNDPSVPEKS
jgi:hypothetical protein